MEQNGILLIDHCIDNGFVLDICEGSSNGLVKFRGKFQEAEAVNKNKRMYPYDVLDENVRRMQEQVKGRRLLGELDHPTDSIVHFANASHVVTKLWWEGKVLMGEGDILPTPSGEILKALIHSGIPIGISSRGVGNGTTNENGILVIGESYKLITFDAVADPSTYAAFQKKVAGGQQTESVTARRVNTDTVVNSSRKNEGTCIDNVSKQKLLTAYLGTVIKSKADNYKVRI